MSQIDRFVDWCHVYWFHYDTHLYFIYGNTRIENECNVVLPDQSNEQLNSPSHRDQYCRPVSVLILHEFQCKIIKFQKHITRTQYTMHLLTLPLHLPPVLTLHFH